LFSFVKVTQAQRPALEAVVTSGAVTVYYMQYLVFWVSRMK